MGMNSYTQVIIGYKYKRLDLIENEQIVSLLDHNGCKEYDYKTLNFIHCPDCGQAFEYLEEKQKPIQGFSEEIILPEGEEFFQEGEMIENGYKNYYIFLSKNLSDNAEDAVYIVLFSREISSYGLFNSKKFNIDLQTILKNKDLLQKDLLENGLSTDSFGIYLLNQMS